jgi:short-subunit dehydrogenase
MMIGSIMNASSVGALARMPGCTAYAATQAFGG